MPTFTNTELISGTQTSAAQKPVEPEDIAAAVVKVLDKPKTHVSVPPWGRFIRAGHADAVGQGRRWLSHKIGQRHGVPGLRRQGAASYEQRAQAAQGVVEGPQGAMPA